MDANQRLLSDRADSLSTVTFNEVTYGVVDREFERESSSSWSLSHPLL